MKIETHKCFSTTKKVLINPILQFEARIGRVDSILKFFKEMNPSELNAYALKLQTNFAEAVGEYYFDPNVIDWEQIRENLTLISNFPDLEKIVFQFICKTLQLPSDYTADMGEVELLSYDSVKVGQHVSYYCVKTFVDVYGRDEGTAIYKQIVPKLVKEIKANIDSERSKPEDPKAETILDMHKRNVKEWCKNGLVDFSVSILDDYKIIYRFDRCLIPEVLKEFKDRDLAYLASCYMGENPEWKEDRAIHMRRSQNLHHAKFCDEFYWNNHVYPDAEQPDLKFVENMGKDEISK